MIGKLLAYLRGYLLRRKMHISGPIKSFGRTIVDNRHGIIKIGKRSTLWPDVKFTLTWCQGASRPVVEIGEFSSIGDRTQIHCGSRVTIGNYVLISWDVNILEYDYHAPGGGPATPEPILIEDEVWIGARAMILKGVTIGKGAIIGAGAVVTKSIPAYTFAAGNPARSIKRVISWRGSHAEENSDAGGESAQS